LTPPHPILIQINSVGFNMMLTKIEAGKWTVEAKTQK